MPTTYERLERDTQGARARFMDIPVVSMLLGGGASAAAMTPEAFAQMKSVYARFLIESYYHVRVASQTYALASSRVKPKDDEIRRWLLAHAVEEDGHHIWIMDDLRALGLDPSGLPTGKPSAPTDALVAWLYYVAGVHNPIAILADSYVIEGLSQLFASQLAGTMQEVLSIPDSAVTYLARHGVADQGHMDDLRHLINAHVKDEEDYQDMVQCAKVEFALYGHMMEVISEGPMGHGSETQAGLALPTV